MKLVVVSPALNEEHNIKNIIESALDSRKTITDNSPVTEVEITVVSDGSSDNTASIALEFADKINVIVFEKNRGYGAAIKEGWKESDADILGFIDADGTCDPNNFADLCTALVEEKADIISGCRLNKKSKMPLVRKLGNRAFAFMLTVFSSWKMRDIASGMRVVRKDSLSKLLPLPDGLHFTPSMSARAMLSNKLMNALSSL